ncbi:MAG: thioredoxin domain-containing protein [Bacteroidales bacterium]
MSLKSKNDLEKKTNHLKGQTSPYLLQHLYNPVDWHPWGEEALQKARGENKPLLISIGYSACHWCHVMERESFENQDVARLMNRHFVCVKVDREERPDIDHLYMDAVQLVSGQGGWPLNCFALPDGRPFWGGTYFPADQWKNILLRVAELYENQYADLEEQAGRLTGGVASNGLIPPAEEAPLFSQSDGQQLFESMMEGMDALEGGTRGAPKFPLPGIHMFLLHYYALTGEPEALLQARKSLDKMAMGGIFDQLGGGFARYATDDQWRVPHFEKMLYDNAQLISLYAGAYQVCRDPLYREVVYETLGFVQRELTASNGLFFSALDADSEGVEGKYYVWTDKEVDEILGETAPLFKKYYQVGAKGYWESGLNILMRTQRPEAFASEQGIDPDAFQKTLSQSRKKLLNLREQRIRPALDDKVLVSWNALMIQALSDAYAAFGEQTFLDRAMHAARFILANAVGADGRLFRKLDGKQASIDGFLDDYALMIQSLIRLFEVSMLEAFILPARALTEYVLEHFSASGTSLFCFSSDGGESLAAPAYEIHDNVIPASNSVMATNLFVLANLFEKPEWARRGSEMLRDIRPRLDRFGGSFSNWGRLLLNHAWPFHVVVVSGPGAEEKTTELNGHFLPAALIAGTASPAGSLPVFEKRFDPAHTLIHVCSMGQCKLPVESVGQALGQLEG